MMTGTSQIECVVPINTAGVDELKISPRTGSPSAHLAYTLGENQLFVGVNSGFH